MAVGEYVSVASQGDLARAEIEVERQELESNAEAEQAELAELYISRGVDRALALRFPATVARPRASARDPHPRRTRRPRRSLPSPYLAAGSSFLAFSVGAMLPVCRSSSALPPCGRRRSWPRSRCSSRARWWPASPPGHFGMAACGSSCSARSRPESPIAVGAAIGTHIG